MKKFDEITVAKTVGQAIARKRVECEMTQEAVAEALGIGNEAVSRIERGAVMPTIARLMELAQIFSCRVDELLIESSYRPVDQAGYLSRLIEPLSDHDRRLVIEIIEKLAVRLHESVR